MSDWTPDPTGTTLRAPDRWAVGFDGLGYTVLAPHDGVCGWAPTLPEAVAKADKLRAEGVWR